MDIKVLVLTLAAYT